MLNELRIAGVCVLALLAADLRAGWQFESREAVFESHRNDAQQIVLATLHDVRQLSQAEVDQIYGSGFLADRTAFAFHVEFNEILRGKPSKQPLVVPFAFIAIPEDPLRPRTNQQREANLEGHKAVLIVHQQRGPARPVVSVWPVSSFEADERVKFWQKATILWNTANLEERRANLLAGCRDSLPAFQDYCCRRLANWSGGKPDVHAAEQLERLTALPVIWKQFLDPATPLGVLATCDEILEESLPAGGRIPSDMMSWQRRLRRHSLLIAPAEDSQIDFNLYAQKLAALSHFPGRERQTYQSFVEIIQSAPPRYRSITLSHLANLYRPHSLDEAQRRLNQEIWDRLLAAIANSDSAQSAAHAIYDIARDYAYVGSLPTHVSKALAAPQDELPDSIAVTIRSHFDHLRQELPNITLAAPLVERLRKEGYVNLTVTTRSQLGKKVVFVANPGHSLKSDPVFGEAAWSSWSSWHDEPVWIEKPADWPQGGTGLMVVTGTLVERRDVPVFRLDMDLDAPFQAGLPIPTGYDAEEIRGRYIIVDVAWQLVNAPQAKQIGNP